MRILYVGDIMGRPGIDTVAQILPEMRSLHEPDLIIAQAENVTEGRGMSGEDMQELQSLGIDCFTGGNWSTFRDGVLNDTDPVTRPANYTTETPGKGYRYIGTSLGEVLVISLLGKIVGKDADKIIKNPLQTIDEILEKENDRKKIATVVNFHGDYSSEKRIIGYYLDGRVSAVIGDHWHVPTADAMVLPKGTAHITDVGMCGSLHSSLGVKLESVIPRWQKGKTTRNVIEDAKPYQFNAVLVEIDKTSGLASNITHIQKIIS